LVISDYQGALKLILMGLMDYMPENNYNFCHQIKRNAKQRFVLRQN